MRIATWNVNSLKARQEAVDNWLARARPDILLMQETKLGDADAPVMAFAMHGYQLVEAIRAATGGGLEFGEGCIYPILHRLESQGILQANREQVAGRVRLVYRVTRKGQARLVRFETTWQRVVAAVNHALEGGERGRQALA